jgi:F-type H+-transporting ATPase subunit a
MDNLDTMTIEIASVDAALESVTTTIGRELDSIANAASASAEQASQAVEGAMGSVSQAVKEVKTPKPVAGRYIEHPPEPPHFIQMLYKGEQKALKKAYLEAHPEVKEYLKSNPKAYEKFAVESWLRKNPETGKWEQVEGQKPTTLQILHAGTLKEPLPLIGYAPWENHVFFGIGGIFLIALFVYLTQGVRGDRRKALREPSRPQMVIEMIVGAFDDFCKGVLGEQNGRFYMPFIGTLFMLILTLNLMGLVPGMKASTASIVITFSLALCSFIVVQATAWIKLGPLTYLHHLAGSPKDAVGWVLAPLFLVLEGISDFVAKPLSLALRLMGNILGKDILLGAFLGMGISLTSLVGISQFGVPLTYPFYFLGLLLSTIQALVFSLLTMIYVMMVLPHDHDHDHDHHGPEAGHHGHHGDSHAAAVHERVPD